MKINFGESKNLSGISEHSILEQIASSSISSVNVARLDPALECTVQKRKIKEYIPTSAEETFKLFPDLNFLSEKLTYALATPTRRRKSEDLDKLEARYIKELNIKILSRMISDDILDIRIISVEKKQKEVSPLDYIMSNESLRVLKRYMALNTETEKSEFDQVVNDLNAAGLNAACLLDMVEDGAPRLFVIPKNNTVNGAVKREIAAYMVRTIYESAIEFSQEMHEKGTQKTFLGHLGSKIFDPTMVLYDIISNNLVGSPTLLSHLPDIVAPLGKIDIVENSPSPEEKLPFAPATHKHLLRKINPGLLLSQGIDFQRRLSSKFRLYEGVIEKYLECGGGSLLTEILHSTGDELRNSVEEAGSPVEWIIKKLTEISATPDKEGTENKNNLLIKSVFRDSLQIFTGYRQVSPVRLQALLNGDVSEAALRVILILIGSSFLHPARCSLGNYGPEFPPISHLCSCGACENSTDFFEHLSEVPDIQEDIEHFENEIKRLDGEGTPDTIIHNVILLAYSAIAGKLLSSNNFILPKTLDSEKLTSFVNSTNGEFYIPKNSTNFLVIGDNISKRDMSPVVLAEPVRNVRLGFSMNDDGTFTVRGIDEGKFVASDDATSEELNSIISRMDETLRVIGLDAPEYGTLITNLQQSSHCSFDEDSRKISKYITFVDTRSKNSLELAGLEPDSTETGPLSTQHIFDGAAPIRPEYQTPGIVERGASTRSILVYDDYTIPITIALDEFLSLSIGITDKIKDNGIYLANSSSDEGAGLYRSLLSSDYGGKTLTGETMGLLEIVAGRLNDKEDFLKLPLSSKLRVLVTTYNTLLKFLIKGHESGECINFAANNGLYPLTTDCLKEGFNIKSSLDYSIILSPLF